MPTKGTLLQQTRFYFEFAALQGKNIGASSNKRTQAASAKCQKRDCAPTFLTAFAHYNVTVGMKLATSD